MTTKSFNDLFDDLVHQRALNDLKPPLSTSYTSPKTNRRELHVIMNLSNKNAERHSLARAAAESDIRNLVSFAAAANHWVISHCNHKLYINADATQFQVGGSLQQTMKVKVYNERN